MEFKPVISALQTSVGNLRGPDSYMANVGGPLGTLQGMLEWQLTHLCRFHQIIYADLKARDAKIGRQYQELKKASEAAKSASDEESEGYAIVGSRIRTAIMDADDEVEKTKNLADHYTVIGLWATVEQYMGKVYVPLAAHVMNVVLGLVRNEIAEKSICDPAALARGARDSVIDYATEHSVSIEVNMPKDLARLHVNASQIHMTLVNVLRNAIEAECSRITIMGVQRGLNFELAVADDGRGIEAERSRQAFEPLYTTRFHSGGIGLGLSLCKRILQAHDGSIAIAGQPNQGAVVTITLPSLT